MLNTKCPFMLSASALCLLSANPLFAQQADNAARPESSDEATEGDIIVTAQRRGEELSKTPVSVAILSTDALAKAQIVSEQDLRSATPGLSVRASLNSNQLNYSLRGQSQDAFSGTRPGVLPYFNEVQIGGSGSTAFYDLQSIQVLKGPQGTLFGRSATGGAVLLQTAKPTSEFGGYLNAGVGDYDALKFEGALNVPVVKDALNVRVAGFYQERDGFQRNIFTNTKVGGLEKWGLRGSASLDVGAFRNELVVDYYHSDSQSMVGVISGLLPFPGPVAGGPPFVPISFLYAGTADPISSATGAGTVTAFITPAFLPPGVTPGTATPAQLAAAQATAASIATPFYNAYFADPRRPASGITAYLATQNARGPYVINSNGENSYRAKNTVITNTTSLDIGPDTTIKNIFGYARLNSLAKTDADGTPYAISEDNLGQDVRITQISNELQLLGKAFDGKLSYVGGGYFSSEKYTSLGPNEFFDILLGGQRTDNDQTTKNRTFAGYGQGTYQLTDKIGLTLGARYTSERVRKIILPTDTNFGLCASSPTIFDCDQDKTFNRLSWQIGVQNEVTSDLLLYAVTRRSYKSGGFNGTVAPRVGSAASGGDSYRSERVTDVELGVKYRGQLGAVPARANLALFHNWIDDSQRAAYTLAAGAPAVVTVNVPASKVYGAELDGQIKPASWLTLGGTLNYTKAKYTDGQVIANGAPQVFDQVPDTPKFSGTLFADVTVPVADDINAILHGDIYHQSSTSTTPQSQNSAGTTISGYSLAAFRVGVESESRGWSLTANLKNAFNKTHYVGGIPTGNIYQINILIPGERRTFNVEARIKF